MEPTFQKHILCEIDHSLKRLNMDYVELYIIHRGTTTETLLVRA